VSKLFPVPDKDYDNKSFTEEMNDLGVKVEKAHSNSAQVLSDWIIPGNKGGRQTYDLSLRKTHLAINQKWMKKIAGDKGKIYLQFRVVKYKGKPALLFREDRSGFSLKKPALDTRAWQMTMSPIFLETLNKYGVEFGHYKISIVKDGYLAVIE
jgi:hypothetical protein